MGIKIKPRRKDWWKSSLWKLEHFDWYLVSLTNQWDIEFKDRKAVKIQARPKKRA